MNCMPNLSCECFISGCCEYRKAREVVVLRHVAAAANTSMLTEQSVRASNAQQCLVWAC